LQKYLYGYFAVNYFIN